jgi:hypothetical protein
MCPGRATRGISFNGAGDIRGRGPAANTNGVLDSGFRVHP